MNSGQHRRTLASNLAALAFWAAVICLLAGFVGWLLKRKSTAWLGIAFLLIIPVTFCTAAVINCVLLLTIDHPDLYSDKLFYVEMIIGLVLTLSISVGVTEAKDAAIALRKKRNRG